MAQTAAPSIATRPPRSSRLRDEFAARRWLQIILVTGHATVDTAIAAIRLEASDYLIKPVEPAALRESVGHALKRADSLRKVERAKPESTDAAALREFADVATDSPETCADEPARADGGARTHQGKPRDPRAAAPPAGRTADDFRRRSDARARVGNDRGADARASRGRALSVTSLALSSQSPATTALRRIEDLIQCGLATRTPDPVDRRRSYVELTSEGAKRMQVFLEGFARTVLG